MSEPIKKKSIVSKGGPFRTRGKVYEVRKESNDEVITHALLEFGFVTILIRLGIRAESGQYVGFHGANLYRDFETIKEVREFRGALKKFIEEYKDGGNASDGD